MQLKKYLVAMLVLAAFAGSVLATGSTEAGDATVEEAPLLRVLNGGWFGTDYNSVPSKAVIEERTNTRFEMITVPWGELLQKQQVMIASGDYPDIMGITDNSRELRYVEGGILEPLDEYFDDHVALATYITPEEWEVMRHPDGHIYAAPSTTWVNWNATTGERLRVLFSKTLQYRGDWMEKYGLEIPTTIDEYLEVARFVATQDPDENGKDDTYAFGGRGSVDFIFDHIFGAFGTLPNIWFEHDGEIVEGAVLPEAKEALLLINTMWNEGLIDPEFITDDSARHRSKWLGGRYGADFTWTRTIDPNDPYTKDFNAQVPGGYFVVGEPLTGPGTVDRLIAGRSESRRGWERTAVLSTSEHVEAAVRLLAYMASNEGMWYYNFGIEGEHHEIMPDGSVKLADNEVRAEYGITFAYCPPILPTFSHMEKAAAYREGIAKWMPYVVGPATDRYLVPEIGEYGSELSDFIDEELIKMIVGETPIEGGFEDFVEEWESRGGRELYDALNAAYRAAR